MIQKEFPNKIQKINDFSIEFGKKVIFTKLKNKNLNFVVYDVVTKLTENFRCYFQILSDEVYVFGIDE